LNIEKQIQEDHHAQLTVQVEADRLEGMKRRAAGQLAKRVKIPGFRPGKAPYAVIVRQIGEATILEEAIELLVDEIYLEVIKEAEIKPYGPGRLENVTSTDPVTIVFSVPLEAETTLGDYHAIQKAYEPDLVTDKDVADFLQGLLEQHAIIEPVERPAQVGDLVAVNLSATRLGEADESEVMIPERSASIIIRPSEPESTDVATNRQDEWPFPGFSQHLIGLVSDDEESFEYTYPEDATYSTLKGAEATFQIKVESVKSRQLPELDDEFAKTVGEFDTLDALQEEIRKSLEGQAQASYNERYDEEILDAAVEQTVFKYPPEMVDQEVETVVNDFRRRLERQGMDMDLYLKTRSIDMDAFKEEVKPVAEGRLKRALFLVEFGNAENIEVKPEELEQETFSTMDYLYSTLPERDARKLSSRDVYSNIVGNVLADMLSRRSLGRFREICSGGMSKEQDLEEISPEDPDSILTEPVAEGVDTETATTSPVEDSQAEESTLSGAAE
jgi:trigger factor